MCLAGYLAAAAFCAGSFAACAQKTLAKPYTLMFAANEISEGWALLVNRAYAVGISKNPAMHMVCLTTSVLLFYYWLGTHGFSIQVKLPVTILFLLAAPMVYQFIS